mmetsp:Transcript_86575/g.169390  ORF Transcript_86575/g.169390 Transcript_86575/m.169390 type:complete len:258 (-) Transcript_86575:15-788(-)
MTMRIKQDYRSLPTRLKIDTLLGEERRWISKRLAQREHAPGAPSDSEPAEASEPSAWALRGWRTVILTNSDPEVGAASLPGKALREATELAQNTSVDSCLGHGLGFIRGQIQRLEFKKIRLAQYIARSDSAFRSQVRGALQLIKEKTDGLRALLAEREAAGEVEESNDMLPSQRDNLCANIEQMGIDAGFRKEVKSVCDALDILHGIVEAGEDDEAACLQLLGRMEALKRRPGYFDSPIWDNLELLLSDEWSWLAAQ